MGKNEEPDSRPEAKILKSDIQTTSIIASQGLPEGREIPHPRFNSEELELNNIIMRPCDVLLCSLTQHFLDSTHFSHGKYPVSKHNSGRALIMILEGRRVEPANDRLFEFIMYVALIFTAISLGAAILLALYYLRSCLKRCLKRSCWHEEVELVSRYSSGTELGLRNGMNKVGIPADQLERGQDSSEDDDDGIVVVIKGVQEDQVSVFIVKGANGMDQISSHVSGGGTKCGHERQPDGSCYVADIATVDDNADNGTEQADQVAPAL